MVRRAILDSGAHRATDDEALPPDPGPVPAGRSATRPRRGSGGRWVIWVLRGIVWLVLLLIGYRGVTAIIAGPAAPSPATAPSARAGSAFPTTLAEAYALQFGSAYLNFSPDTADQRASLLATFMPSGSDSQLGWNGAGTEQLQSEQVASVQVHGDHNAIITLLAVVNDRMIELGVPVYAADGGMVVSGEPALLSAPAHAVPPQPESANSDQATVTALQGQLPPFFRAYASDDGVTLGRFLAPGGHVTGLNGAVTFGSIQSITAPYGGATRDITVVVVWHVNSDPAATRSSNVGNAQASVEMTYRMTVVRQGSSWYVQSIGASPQSPGPP